MIYDAIVLGAGASGLFFAAARPPGLSVLLLERQDRPGRKLLLSGGGKCNLTNLRVSAANYLCAAPDFPAQALQAFTPKDMLALMAKRRIPVEEREHGQIFCKRGAEELRDLLLGLALAGSGELKTGQEIQALYRRAKAAAPANPKALFQADPNLPAGAAFAVRANGQSYFSRTLLVASGGPAWPKSGATSFGLRLAKEAGHEIIPPRPALTPLRFPPDWPLRGLQGLSLPARVSLLPDAGASFNLPLLFTHQGLSGPACLQISSRLGSESRLRIDFLPGQNLERMIDQAEGEGGKKQLLPLLRQQLPERLALALLEAAGLESLRSARLAELSRARRRALAQAFQDFQSKPLAPDFSRAEASSGGVSCAGVDPASMQSRMVPGLFFCGEVLDVCGELGGYNLHWAWASAASAARAVAALVKRENG
ncbi:NAD(P)/FAD-dependent oxidoreductase [Desulfovibrio sp. OttesenSCG-928-C14]|nr:NAD(P)/FAD-dependent oxidoreductase [Desulfovibrio sp. OttesenSCG-928-C14]